jgi:hypothetical protein
MNPVYCIGNLAMGSREMAEKSAIGNADGEWPIEMANG